MEILNIQENRDYNRMNNNNFGKIIVLVFHAAWHQHSQDYLESMKTILEISDLDPENVLFAQIDADKVPQVAQNYKIQNVPTVIVTDVQKTELKRFDNVQPAEIVDYIENFIPEYQKNFENKRVQMHEKIEKLINQSPVLIFIKGTPTAPECKFTREFLGIMKDLEVQFTFYDIIADNDMRHWLRHYNKWPTYPQMYVAGELQGGLDRIKQKIEDGSIQAKIPQSARKYDPEQRFNKLVQENTVILFTSGMAKDENLSQAQKDSIKSLVGEGIKFKCFDCSTDSGLLQYVQQKHGEFPHLYSQKQYLGSQQQIKNLIQNSQLLEKIPGSEWQLNGEQKLKYLLNHCDIIAFIEGVPNECKGEKSKNLVSILDKHHVLYEYYNVAADIEVLGHLKNISNYEEVPQLYIKGQLIGGLSTVEKLEQDGDLQELIKDLPKKN